jgi:hypothetical protein
MDQEDVYEAQMDLEYSLEAMCDKLSKWQEDALEVLSHDDTLEELRDKMLHVDNLLESLQCKTN